MRPITVTLGPNAAGQASPPVRMDDWADAPLGVQVAIIGGLVNFTVQHSFDDPNDLVNPVPLANMFWDTSLVPLAAAPGTAGLSFAMPVSPCWMRIVMNSGAGSLRMTLLQYNNVEL